MQWYRSHGKSKYTSTTSSDHWNPFCKKKGRGCAFESWKFPLSAHAEVPVQLWAFPQMLRHVTETQLIPRVRRPPASFWFASSLNFLLNISLWSSWSGWKTFRPTILTTCCGAIPCLSIVVSAKWTFVCQQVVCGGVPNVLFSWAATQVYFWRSQMGGGWV